MLGIVSFFCVQSDIKYLSSAAYVSAYSVSLFCNLSATFSNFIYFYCLSLSTLSGVPFLYVVYRTGDKSIKKKKEVWRGKRPATIGSISQTRVNTVFAGDYFQ